MYQSDIFFKKYIFESDKNASIDDIFDSIFPVLIFIVMNHPIYLLKTTKMKNLYRLI